MIIPFKFITSCSLLTWTKLNEKTDSISYLIHPWYVSKVEFSLNHVHVDTVLQSCCFHNWIKSIALHSINMRASNTCTQLDQWSFVDLWLDSHLKPLINPLFLKICNSLLIFCCCSCWYCLFLWKWNNGLRFSVILHHIVFAKLYKIPNPAVRRSFRTIIIIISTWLHTYTMDSSNILWNRRKLIQLNTHYKVITRFA